MKRSSITFLFILVFIFLVSISLRPLVIFLVNGQLNKVFREAKLSVKNFSVGFIDGLTLEVKIGSLDKDDLHIEGIDLKLNLMQRLRDISIRKIKYSKIAIEDILAQTQLKNRALSLSSISGKILVGQVDGDVVFYLGKENRYKCNFQFVDLNLEDAVNKFDLQERFSISGKLSGSMKIEGKGQDLNMLEGNFSLPLPGGMFIIKDDKLLGKLARDSNQPLDIFVESFKNYRYNTGVMKLSLEKVGLVLNIVLDGETGKRNLNIVAHNFIKKGDRL